MEQVPRPSKGSKDTVTVVVAGGGGDIEVNNLTDDDDKIGAWI